MQTTKETRTLWMTPPAIEPKKSKELLESESRYTPSEASGPSIAVSLPLKECRFFDAEAEKPNCHTLCCEERDCCVEKGWRKSSRNPPKAIVTPLIGGIAHSSARAEDTTRYLSSVNSSSHIDVCRTCQSHLDSLSCTRAQTLCGPKNDRLVNDTTYGWKGLLEMKDRMLAQKNHLIERQKLSISNLQQQLKDMTVADVEFKTSSTKLKEVRDLHADYTKISEADTSKDKDLLITNENLILLEKSREKCKSLNKKLLALQLENVALVKECQKLQKILFESEVHSRHELKAMRERHKQRFVEATAELRLRHRAMAKRVKALELQLLKNSDIISALNSEQQVKNDSMGGLKLSMNELLLQNQHLAEEDVSLQESTIKALDVKVTSDSSVHQTHQLTAELASCIGDLKSLISLCLSLVEGCDPNASQMLCAEDHHTLLELSVGDHELDFEYNLQTRLTEIKHLRVIVDKLQEVVSEQFATRASNACHIQ